MTPDFLSRADLARRLGCSTRTINRDLNRGLLPHPIRRPNKRNEWPAEEIEAWLAAGKPDRDTWTKHAWHRRKR